ncbi:MAG TPA: SDR family NAD(P)-dependent oxidoreductase, partial [Armatimonadota bacterium]|nr:SDR family NAD(P)-dependent oxidoreductase [Armatimonadota bacterium]
MAGRESRVVLVTGASSGLGAAIVEACSAAGYRVALAARRRDRLEALARKVARPDALLPLCADMRDPESIRAMVEQTRLRFGRIDALVA